MEANNPDSNNLDSNNLDSFDWDRTTFEGVRREQIREWSKLSLSEILSIQEEMADLAKWLHPERF